MTSEPALGPSPAEQLAGRLFQAAAGFGDMGAVYLGVRLGLYEALDAGGEATAAEVAARAGANQRYCREWLEQQASTGMIDLAAPSEDPEARRYRLPAATREVFLDPLSLNYFAPLSRALFGAARRIDDLLAAFRSGGGVRWEAFGPDMIESQAEANRPAFTHLLAQQWLPALPAIHARLQASPPARVADVACGAGWSSVAIARAYPTVTVDAFDVDEASVELVRTNARDAGVADRVRVKQIDGAGMSGGPYDLVTIFEALHDLARPVEVLTRVRHLLAPGGAVLVVDERVDDEFCAPAVNPMEPFLYAASLLVCLPTAMAEPGAAGTGTVMRLPVLERYAKQAGFAGVREAGIEHPMFRFYLLAP
ncbi:MAG: methyltransferase domain-containing protein [Dehalococcoidia bacterium]|nr:methyltransferase domain-containing protein [Dehalococcoidia bacterium]